MSGRFDATRTPLSGLIVLQRKTLSDERGHLSRLFDAEGLAAYGWLDGIAQVNETVTLKGGTVRGFHFQRPPYAEAKLVTCLRGKVYDVAVDVRVGSRTYLHHFGVELSEQNACSLLIPAGFAHGFQSLTDDAQLIYAHSAPYRSEAEGGLNVLDPALAVKWPFTPENLSLRDLGHAPISLGFEGIRL